MTVVNTKVTRKSHFTCVITCLCFWLFLFMFVFAVVLIDKTQTYTQYVYNLELYFNCIILFMLYNVLYYSKQLSLILCPFQSV